GERQQRRARQPHQESRRGSVPVVLSTCLHYPARWARIAEAQGGKRDGSTHPARLTALANRTSVASLLTMLAETPASHRIRRVKPSRRDRALTPLHRWVWRDVDRRARKLIRFAE